MPSQNYMLQHNVQSGSPLQSSITTDGTISCAYLVLTLYKAVSRELLQPTKCPFFNLKNPLFALAFNLIIVSFLSCNVIAVATAICEYLPTIWSDVCPFNTSHSIRQHRRNTWPKKRVLPQIDSAKVLHTCCNISSTLIQVKKPHRACEYRNRSSKEVAVLRCFLHPCVLSIVPYPSRGYLGLLIRVVDKKPLFRKLHRRYWNPRPLMFWKDGTVNKFHNNWNTRKFQLVFDFGPLPSVLDTVNDWKPTMPVMFDEEAHMAPTVDLF